MELFERAATLETAHELLDELLAAAGDGLGSPPVRIEDEAVLVPAGLYELLVRVIEEHGLDGEVRSRWTPTTRVSKTSCAPQPASSGSTPTRCPQRTDRRTADRAAHLAVKPRYGA